MMSAQAELVPCDNTFYSNLKENGIRVVKLPGFPLNLVTDEELNRWLRTQTAEVNERVTRRLNGSTRVTEGWYASDVDNAVGNYTEKFWTNYFWD